MPRASRQPVNKTLNKDLEESFSDLISSLQRSSDIKSFLNDFLTKEEKTMLFKRLMLHLMIEKGYESSKIQSTLGIRYETIRVHKNNWERGSEVYRSVLRKIASKQKARLIFKRIEKIFDKLDLAIKARNDMRARARFATGD